MSDQEAVAAGFDGVRSAIETSLDRKLTNEERVAGWLFFIAGARLGAAYARDRLEQEEGKPV